MKKIRLEKAFLEELAKVPNESLACKNVGLSRQSIHRWKKEDPKFRKKCEEALQLGTESINDLAESKLIANIQSGKQRSIEYWLDNNKRAYIKPRSKDFWNDNRQYKGVTEFYVIPYGSVPKNVAKKIKECEGEVWRDPKQDILM